MMNSTAGVGLCLMMFLTGCAGREMKERLPEVVKVRELVPLPAWCLKIEPVTLESGANSDDVEREQHRAILAYEARVRACRELNQPSHPPP